MNPTPQRLLFALSFLFIVAVGCATPEPAVEQATLSLVEEPDEPREISQADLDGDIQERVVGFWGEPGWLVRYNDREFAVYDPQDGQVVARKAVEGRLVAVALSPEGDQACVVHGNDAGGALRLGLYDTEGDTWTWEKRLSGEVYMIVANVGQCLVGYEDSNPEVFQIADGTTRIRHMSTPAEPMGVFSIREGRRQWWISPVDLLGDADEEAGTRWLITQVESDGWTFEGEARARCFEADEVELRAVAADEEDAPLLREMARRSQRSYAADGCEPAAIGEWMRFGDGEHRIARIDSTELEPGHDEIPEDRESSEFVDDGADLPTRDSLERAARQRLEGAVDTSIIRRGRDLIRRF